MKMSKNKTIKITLTNEFHGTSVTLRIKNRIITERQYARADKALCGMDDCRCRLAIIPPDHLEWMLANATSA